MAVPKRRTSRARQGNRRSHHHKTPIQVSFCTRCGHAIQPHISCWNCGWSNIQNREVAQVEAAEEE
ncbi:MAG: 50S ribosomal protein L32 [Planctomycetota bacterium]